MFIKTSLDLTTVRDMRFPSLYGVWLQFRPLDLTFWLSTLGLYGGFHRRHILAAPDNALFLDIGANQGLFAVLAQKRGLDVVAFEPNPKRFVDLVTNLSINKGAGAVPLCAAITGDQPGLIQLRVPKFHSGGASIVGEKGEALTALTLGRAFFNQLAEQERRPVWVKIDVEGAESHVLNALFASRLGPRIDGLIIELSQNNHDSDALCQLTELIEAQGLSAADRQSFHRHGDAFYQRLVPAT